MPSADDQIDQTDETAIAPSIGTSEERTVVAAVATAPTDERTVVAPEAPAPLDQPLITALENLGTTQVLLRLSPMANVRSFQVQTGTDGKTWQEAGIYTQGRRIVLQALTPATVYYVRARGIGGSTGRSDWSVPASIMAT